MKLTTSIHYILDNKLRNCKMYGVNMNLVAARQLRGWTLEEAMRRIDKEVIEWDGTKLTLFQWCELLDLHHEDTYLRIIRGHKLEDIAKE